MTVSRAEHDRIVKEYATQVNHRANNLLAVIQGLIRASGGDNVDAFKATIEGRISALAQAHSLLSDSNWDAIPLRDIINGELMNHINPRSDRIQVIGIDIALPGPRAQNAAMIMHELATNAAYYGALSNDKGCVRIEWQPRETGLVYWWTEYNQTGIVEPAQLGTGLTLVKRLAGATRATTEFVWKDSGLSVRFFQPYDLYRTRESVMAA